MPHSRFIPRIKIFRAAIVAAAFTLTAQAAEWRDCEKAKLRALQLEKNAGEQKTSKRKSREDDRHQRIEHIDTWLWKNCREYAYELRQLEQERM